VFASWQACAHVQTNMSGTREARTGTRGTVTDGGGGEGEARNYVSAAGEVT